MSYEIVSIKKVRFGSKQSQMFSSVLLLGMVSSAIFLNAFILLTGGKFLLFLSTLVPLFLPFYLSFKTLNKELLERKEMREKGLVFCNVCKGNKFIIPIIRGLDEEKTQVGSFRPCLRCGGSGKIDWVKRIINPGGTTSG